jgi:hypothetical protein
MVKKNNGKRNGNRMNYFALGIPSSFGRYEDHEKVRSAGRERVEIEKQISPLRCSHKA